MQNPAKLNDSFDCGASRLVGRMNEDSDGLDGAAPIQSLMQPVAEQIGHRVPRDLVMNRQIGTLGKHLPEQRVCVLAGPSMPGAVRVAEVDVHAGVANKIAMPGHLFALAVGQGLTHRLRDLVELEGEASQCRFRGRIWQSREQDQTRDALRQHADGGLIERALDETDAPVTRHEAIAHLRRPQMDAHHLRDLATPILSRQTRHTPAPTLPQAGDQLFAQLPIGLRVDGAVDGLVLDMQCGLVGYPPQCARNLLLRPKLPEHVCNRRQCRAVRVKLANAPRMCAARLAGNLSSTRNVLTRRRILRQLVAVGAGAVAQCSSDGSQPHALQPHRGQNHALMSFHLLDSSGHLHTLPAGVTY
jgi:hypothetical protein